MDMLIFPPLGIGWLNGWILLCFWWVIQGLSLLVVSKEVRARLFEFDRTSWSALWKHLGDDDIGEDPRDYYFTATLVNNVSESLNSQDIGNPLLGVREYVPCVEDRTVEEICGSAICGTRPDSCGVAVGCGECPDGEDCSGDLLSCESFSE